MRTTVTLDVDVERMLKREAYKQNKSFKVILNSAVRQGLRPQKSATALPKLLPPVALGEVRTKYRNMTFSEIEGELDIEAYLEKEHRIKKALSKHDKASGKV